MFSYHTNRKAFSMLELVFVIAILGIVSSIGAEIIAQVYESYILQRATHRSSVKVELAATQIANRLAYAVPGTVIGRNGTSFTGIDDLDSSDYPVLEWIGYDNDSFSAQATPGWSGFSDIGASSAASLSTPGSNLPFTNTVITNLGGAGITDAALFFPNTYTVNSVGFGGDSSGAVSGLGTGSATSFNVNLAGRTIKEHYKLAWSAYAIVANDNGDGTFDLSLSYNYQPWQGDSYSNALSSTILRNVSVFRFTGSGNTVRFKICQQEKIGTTHITTCKEKAVIR
jgi:prepilin-type N-terminal cleavage/methylation domain-containing protein